MKKNTFGPRTKSLISITDGNETKHFVARCGNCLKSMPTGASWLTEEMKSAPKSHAIAYVRGTVKITYR